MVEITGRTSGPEWPAVWTAARKRLRRELGDAIFDAWIGPLTLECLRPRRVAHRHGQILHVQLGHRALCRPHRTRAARRRRHPGLDRGGGLQAAVSVGGNVVREPAPSPAAAGYLPARDEAGAPDAAMGLWTRMLHPQQTFDSFIPGAATSSVTAPCAPSPRARTRFPAPVHPWRLRLRQDASAQCRSTRVPQPGQAHAVPAAEDFMRHFLGALHRRDTLTFKDELRTAEVLIVDDLQHICPLDRGRRRSSSTPSTPSPICAAA